MQLKTPAKINLTLSIRGRRPDGFHEIESWIVPVAAFDVLHFEAAERFELVVQPPTPGVACDATNLVNRAAQLLAEAAGREMAARITLEKNIPVGAGLGGGSSDAAATLRGLTQLWKLDWGVERLSPIAARLGSDVPLFLDPRAVVVRGRGEIIEPLRASWRGWVALIIPAFGLSTVAVYRKFADSVRPRLERPQPWPASAQSADELGARLFNDLEDAAFELEPRLRALHGRLDGLAGKAVRMTGSGSCLFALFDGEHAAESWADGARRVLNPMDRIEIVQTL